VELTPFSYAVLVLIGRGGAGPHDLVRMARQGRIYWAAAESQFYAEPKRLHAAGYLAARREQGQTHARTHYTLTKNGIAALREWMREPAQFPRIQHEPIVRLLAADLVGEWPVLESLDALRDEIADLNARLDIADEVAATLPHREKYLRLNHKLARAILRVHVEWLDEVERTLGSPGARRTSSPRARAPRGGGSSRA
jgi:DNA-binding PadR family transcriptional regulator